MTSFTQLWRMLSAIRTAKPVPAIRRCRSGFEALEPRSLLALVPLAPLAADDAYSMTEDQVLVGNVIAGTAEGADQAATPNLPLKIVALNGQSAVGGANLTMPSGASLRMNADGSFAYDPSASATLSSIPAGGSEQDHFAYTIAPDFSNVVLLGDSLSDQGRLFAATQQLFPPDPPYYQGRMSNGPVWIETLAPRLGLPNSLANNFAVAGAATSTANYNESLLGGADLPGLADELNQFVAGLNGQPADPHALYIVWAGANDFFLPFSDPAAAITSAVTNLATTVGTLHAFGAQHIAVINMPDLGLTPYALATGRSPSLTALSAAFNGALSGALAGPAFQVTLIDAFGRFQEIAADPAAFGLMNVTSPAFDGTSVVGNPDEFLFWDAVHPTAAGHRLIADAIFAGLTSEAEVTIDVADDTTPPRLSIENLPGTIVGALSLRLSASDDSPADQAAHFTYTIDWGDGSPAQSADASSAGIVAAHNYRSGAAQRLSVRVIDQDGDAGAGFEEAVVWGTSKNDQIELSVLGNQLRIRAGARSLARMNATAISRVVVFGLGGNDVIQATGSSIPVELDGGAGHDALGGSRLDDILRGGAGHDLLFGMDGNDWLSGGDGYDLLCGGNGDDILDGQPETQVRSRRWKAPLIAH